MIESKQTLFPPAHIIDVGKSSNSCTKRLLHIQPNNQLEDIKTYTLL